MINFPDTCKRQWLGIGELPGFHSLLLLLQSCQHVSQVKLHRGFALFPCCFDKSFLSDDKRQKVHRIFKRLIITTEEYQVCVLKIII